MESNLRFNPKRVCVGINDVYKAYDHVKTDTLKSILDNANKPEISKLVDDYDACDLRVGKALIRRTRGLPQGAKGAPALFNLYMNNVLNNTLKSDFIYADNILLMEKNTKKLLEREEEIINKCATAGLKFEKPWDNWAYSRTNIPCDISSPNSCGLKSIMSNVPKSDHKTTRVLGYQLEVKEDTLIQNIKEAHKGICYKLPRLPPYKAMTYYKQKIKPKFTFHYRNITLPKGLIQSIIRRMTCIRNIPRKYMDINHAYDKGISNYWDKFWSLYTYRKGGYISIPEGEVNQNQFRRYRILCTLMDKYYLSVYQIIKFIIHGNAWILPSNTSYMQLKNNVKMLDLAWFCITRRFSESKMRLVLELTLLNRTRRKKIIEKQLPNLNLYEVT